MSQFLKVDKGGKATAQAVISQSDLNAVAEGGVNLYMQQGGKGWFKLRVRREPNKDPRIGASYEIDAWIPIEGPPEGVEEAARKANKEDASIQGRKAEQDGSLPPQKGEINRKSAEELRREQLQDPNFRSSVAAKDLAAGIGAGNLALKDPIGQKHDGLPAADDKNQPNQSAPGKPGAQSFVEQEKLENARGGATEESKPAAPSPTSTQPNSTGSTTAPAAGKPAPVPGPTKGGAK